MRSRAMSSRLSGRTLRSSCFRRGCPCRRPLPGRWSSERAVDWGGHAASSGWVVCCSRQARNALDARCFRHPRRCRASSTVVGGGSSSPIAATSSGDAVSSSLRSPSTGALKYARSTSERPGSTVSPTWCTGCGLSSYMTCGATTPRPRIGPRSGWQPPSRCGVGRRNA